MRLTIAFDALPLIADLDFAAKNATQAIRAGVNSAAVLSKRAFVQAIPPDAAGRSTTQANVRKQTSPIKRASAGDLSASFRVTNRRFAFSPGISGSQPGNQYAPGFVSWRTFVETGGGSADKSSPHAFILRANGGQVVMVRTASGGSHKLDRGHVKAIYAEAPATAMGQERAVPRQQFEKTARAQVEQQIASRLGVVLRGSPAPAEVSGE